MENIYKLSDYLLDAFGVDELINFVCNLSNDDVIKIINSNFKIK